MSPAGRHSCDAFLLDVDKMSQRFILGHFQQPKSIFSSFMVNFNFMSIKRCALSFPNQHERDHTNSLMCSER